MEWLTRQFGDIFIILLKGDLDAVSVPSLEEFLNKHIEKGLKKFVLNFQDVLYMSSAGIRLLFSVSKKLQNQHGRLCICCTQDVVNDILYMAGVHQILPVCKSEQEAFTKFE